MQNLRRYLITLGGTTEYVLAEDDEDAAWQAYDIAEFKNLDLLDVALDDD